MTNKLTEDKVYFGGHYFLGLTKKFEKYPARSVNLYLESIAASDQGSFTVNLDVSVQYKLNPDEIFKLYSKYSQTYEAIFETKVKDVVLEECLNYNVQPDFYVSRVEIAAAMKKSLIRVFNETQAELIGFQLRGVDLPDTVEDAIIDTVIASQLTTTTSIEQVATLTRTLAENVASEAAAEIKEIDATASATGTLIEAGAQATYTKEVTKARADALLATTRELNLTKTQMFDLLWQKTVVHNPAINKASVGFDETSVTDFITARSLGSG